jgi:hypothetical protein
MSTHPILRTRAAAIAACTVALTLAFASGAVAAAKITSADIKDHTIQAKDLKNGAVGTQQIKNSTVQSDDIKNGTVQSGDVKDGTITSNDIKNGTVQSGDVKDGTITSNDIKDGTVASRDLAKGSVTADKIAPGAVAFPNSLWGTVLRNQVGAARSGLQAGPTGAPMGDGSLQLVTTQSSDLAAYGNSFDFAGFPLDSITSLSYSSYNPDATPAVRPSLRMEINPHLVDDSTPGGALEFTTLIYDPAPGTTGWVTHTNIQDDPLWYLTGSEGATTGCTQANKCTLAALNAALDGHVDTDTAAPAISTGVYFALGSGVVDPTETAVDKFVFNSFVFDFEPNGVFLTPAP